MLDTMSFGDEALQLCERHTEIHMNYALWLTLDQDPVGSLLSAALH